MTRFVPGRDGPGFTDDLDDLIDVMLRSGKAALEHHWGLWYDRRRDDHQMVRRPDGDVWPPFLEQPWARSGRGNAWDGLSKYDLTAFNPWYFGRLDEFADLGDRKGLVLLHEAYFQHNILEAGRPCWAWTSPGARPTAFRRPGSPNEPPAPHTRATASGCSLAEAFYDVSHPVRRAIHRAYIRHGLDVLGGHPNVIFFNGEEYTGPLHFLRFWLDTVTEWERETGRDVLVGLSATKDVQDAILADYPRSMRPLDWPVVRAKYWWYLADGALYSPEGGKSLAPRQQLREWKGSKKRSVEQTARQVREYRERWLPRPRRYSSPTVRTTTLEIAQRRAARSRTSRAGPTRGSSRPSRGSGRSGDRGDGRPAVDARPEPGRQYLACCEPRRAGPDRPLGRARGLLGPAGQPGHRPGRLDGRDGARRPGRATPRGRHRADFDLADDRCDDGRVSAPMTLTPHGGPPMCDEADLNLRRDVPRLRVVARSPRGQPFGPIYHARIAGAGAGIPPIRPRPDLGMTDMSCSPHAVICRAVGLGEVAWTRGFWAGRLAVCRDARWSPTMWPAHERHRAEPVLPRTSRYGGGARRGRAPRPSRAAGTTATSTSGSRPPPPSSPHRGTTPSIAGLTRSSA